DAWPADHAEELADAGPTGALDAQDRDRGDDRGGAVLPGDPADHGPRNHHQRQIDKAVGPDKRQAECGGHAAEEPRAGVDAGAEPGHDLVKKSESSFPVRDLYYTGFHHLLQMYFACVLMPGPAIVLPAPNQAWLDRLFFDDVVFRAIREAGDVFGAVF